MAVRSTTTRRMATVVVATAAVSALGATGASAATSASSAPAPTQSPQAVVPPLSVPQVGLLLNDLLGTVDGLLGSELVAPTPLTESNKDKPLLQRTVANLTGTTKELPLLGGVVGGVTDGAGLSQPTKVGSKPSGPATAVATPAKPRGRHHRVESVATPGSTWTSPMTAAPVVTPVVSTEEHHSPSHIPGFVRSVTKILPSSAAEAAAAGAGAATIALIVLGGIAVTGAAGAASAAGRRGLVSGSVGGSL